MSSRARDESCHDLPAIARPVEELSQRVPPRGRERRESLHRRGIAQRLAQHAQDSSLLRALGTDLLTVRVDLDPA